MPFSWSGDRRSFARKLFACGALACGLPTLLFGSQTYRVQKGDTLSAIARRKGFSVVELRRANDLTGDLIRVGQILKLPLSVSAEVARAAKATANLGAALRPWSLVVAHHSAIEKGNAAIYHRNHLRRGMGNGLAYHFVIGNGVDSGDGEIEIGSRWTQQLDGGHVRNGWANSVGIGICLVGNFQQRRPSARQLASLTALVDYLRRDAMSGGFRFATHKEVDSGSTVCPGRHFPTESLRKRWA